MNAVTAITDPLVSIRGLSIRFAGRGVATVENVGFDIPRAATVALVGESGSGKSIIAHSLAGILTSRHFCLLAPRESDPYHAAFMEQENQRRAPQEAASSTLRTDLDRYTAALGFCDLLSLYLCSGITGAVRIPLAHPADPASQHATSMTVFLAEQTLRLDQPAMTSRAEVYADGWILHTPNVLASHRFEWTIG